MPKASTVDGNGSYYYACMNKGYSSVSRTSEQVSLSSTFSGDQYVTVLGPVDVGDYSNITVTLINNSVNNIKSGSIQVSPDSSNWITMNSEIFANLTSSGMMTASFVNRAFDYLRVQVWPSGSDGAISGSVNAFVSMN